MDSQCLWINFYLKYVYHFSRIVYRTSFTAPCSIIQNFASLCVKPYRNTFLLRRKAFHWISSLHNRRFFFLSCVTSPGAFAWEADIGEMRTVHLVILVPFSEVDVCLLIRASRSVTFKPFDRENLQSTTFLFILLLLSLLVVCVTAPSIIRNARVSRFREFMFQVFVVDVRFWCDNWISE